MVLATKSGSFYSLTRGETSDSVVAHPNLTSLTHWNVRSFNISLMKYKLNVFRALYLYPNRPKV